VDNCTQLNTVLDQVVVCYLLIDRFTMALKIRPTPILTGNAAKRILNIISSNNGNLFMSNEDINKKRESVKKVLDKAKL
jgi:hypothetical protein